ncbi:MAG: kelch repeat-containing protein [Pseudomonadota bacterium]
MSASETWETASDLNDSRVFHSTCAAGGLIIAFGGQNAGGGSGIDSVEAYDPNEDTWTARQPMPNPRLGMMVAEVNGFCYLFGGAEVPGAPAVALTERYDPVTDTWTTLSSMPTARAVGAAAVVNDLVYVAGGAATGNTASQVFDALEIYDPASDTWTSAPAMPTARASLAASAIGERIFYVGGGTAGVLASDTPANEMFDTQTGTWTILAPMPTRRGELAAASTGNTLIAIGGADGQSLVDAVERFDPATGEWSGAEPLPTARWGLRASVLAGRVFVTGGSSEFGFGHNSLSTNEVLAGQGPTINAGFNDAWFNTETPGQGFFIVVYPDIPLLFLAWFTYDTTAPDNPDAATLGDAGSRWLTAQGPFSGNEATLDIFVSRDGRFDSSEPVPVTEAAGTMTVRFESCGLGSVSYTIPDLNLTGEIPISRVAEDNIVLCEALLE